MAEPGFYNDNSNRAYPFVTGTVDQLPSGPMTIANLPDSLVVDAGFAAGVKSRFVSGVHGVFLTKIRRQGDTFYLDFTSDAPGLFGVPLTFVRRLTDHTYATEFVDSGNSGLSASSDSRSGSLSRGPCDEPLWTGFVTTGDMAAFALLLPGNGEVDGAAGAGQVEPALIQNLAGSFVNKLAVANDDRTRATAPAGCPDATYPFEVGVTHAFDLCVVGDVVFTAGYNATVFQNPAGNSITLGAAVGAGAGEPCNPVQAFPGESAAAAGGGPLCSNTVRGINGSGGPQVTIAAGSGVTVTPDPAGHSVSIAVDMSGLATCSEMTHRSESC